MLFFVDLEMEALIVIGFVVIELTKNEANIADANVVIYHRENEYKNNVYNGTEANSSLQMLGFNSGNALSNHSATFLYQWNP